MTLDVHFHGLERSAAVEAKVAERHRKLARHFARMTACRVVLEVPSRNSAKAKELSVKIEISIPQGKPIVVTHAREGGSAQDDLLLAIRDAFDAATRKIDETGQKLARRGRTEKSRRRPAAVTA
jgi:ribosome-associated translation inhibitor RaiA